MLHSFELTWDTAESWFNVSAVSNNRWKDRQGDPMINWKDKGFNLMLDIIMKKFPEPDQELPVMNNTVLDAEVTQIKYDDADGPVTVMTAKGDVHRADHVIVTTSLGVLKSGYATLFNPPLSEEKINVIEKIEYGSVTKLFLQYPEPWWPTRSNGELREFGFYWTEADRNEIANDPERSWMLGLINLMTVESKPRLLSSWITGPYSDQAQKVPMERCYVQTTELIERFLGKTHNITESSGMMWTSWTENKHFRGAYSYRSPATEDSGVTTEELVERIMKNGKPIIMFAGEATSSINYGTVHGAMDTGIREADRLIQLYTD